MKIHYKVKKIASHKLKRTGVHNLSGYLTPVEIIAILDSYGSNMKLSSGYLKLADIYELISLGKCNGHWVSFHCRSRDLAESFPKSVYYY